MTIMVDVGRPYRTGWVMARVFGLFARKGWFLGPISALAGWLLASGVAVVTRATSQHGPHGAVFTNLSAGIYVVGQLAAMVMVLGIQAVVMDVVLADQTAKPFDVAVSLRRALAAWPTIAIYALVRHTDTMFRMVLTFDRDLAKSRALVGFLAMATAVVGFGVAVAIGVTVPAALSERQGTLKTMRRAAWLMGGSRWRFAGAYLVIGFLTTVSATVAPFIAMRAHDPAIPMTALYLTGNLIAYGLTPLMSALLAISYLEMRRVREGGVAGDVAQVFD